MNGRMWTSLVGACLLLLTPVSQAQKIMWKDPVGGSWNDPAKWDLNRVPAAGDSVFITAAGDYTVTMLSATVRHLTLGGAGGTPELSVDVKGGGWLTVSDTLFNSGTLIMTASNLVSGQGGIAVAGGALVNSGTLNISPGAGGGRTLNASLDNRGVVNVDIPLGVTKTSAAHVNSGTINVHTNLTIAQSATNSSFTNRGTVAVDSGRTFLIQQGQFVQDQGTVSGRGTVRMENVKGNLLSDFTVGVPGLQLVSTAVRGGGTLRIPETTTLTLANDSLMCPVDLAGNMAIPGSNGSKYLLGHLTTHASSTITLDVGEYSTLIVDSTFTNAGTITMTSSVGSGYPGALQVRNGSLVNEGTINTVQGSVGGGRTIYASLDNRGVVNVDWPLGVSKTSAAHINSGTINVHNNLTVDQGDQSSSFTNRGTVAVDSGRIFLIRQGRFVQDQGTVSGRGTLRMESVKGSLLSDFSVGVAALQLATTAVRGTGTLRTPETTTVALGTDSIICPMDLAGSMAILGGTGETYFLGRLTTHASTTIVHDLASGTLLVFDSTFTNAGTLTLTDTYGYGGWLQVRNGSLVNEGTINILHGASSDGRTIYASLDNRGVVNVDWPLFVNKTSAAHINSGMINVHNNLTVDQGDQSSSFTNRGTVAVDSGRIFLIRQGRFVQDQGTVSGRGTLRMESVKGSLLSDFTVGVPGLQLVSTAVRGGGTLRIPETTAVAFSTDSIICPMDLAGSLAIPGGTGGTYFLGRLTTHASSTIVINLESGASLIFDSTFTNAGTFTLTDSYGYSGSVQVRNGSLVNEGTINIVQGAGGGRTIYGSLDNRGVINVNWPLSVNKTSASHVNSGTINVHNNLTVDQSGTNPSFTNSGTISLTYGKALVITAGTLTNASTGLLNLEIGGRVPNANLAQVRVSGSMVMGGTLNILPANNFLPEIDDSLALLTFSTRSGAFQSIRVPMLNGNPLLVAGYASACVFVKAFMDYAHIRELTIGQPVPDSLRAGYYRFYKVLLPGGVSPLFRAGCQAPLLAPQLFVTREGPPSRSQFAFRSMADLPQSSEISVAAVDSGMYFMLVHNPELSFLNYTVQVDTLGYMVRRIRVPSAGDNGEVTVEILGAKLQQGARAYLSRLGQATIADTANYLVDATQLNSRFPLANLEEGDWDLTVLNPDSSTALLPHGMTLMQNTAPQLDLLLTGPARIHRDYVGRFYLSATNPSNTNVERALVFIETRPEIEIAAGLDSLASDSLFEDPNLTTWVDSTGMRFFCLNYFNIAPGRTKSVELLIRPTAYGEYHFFGHIATFSRRNYDTLMASAFKEAVALGLVDTSTYPRPAGSRIGGGASSTGILHRVSDEGEDDVAEIQGERKRLGDISKDAAGLVGDAAKTLYFPLKKPGPAKLAGLAGLLGDMKGFFDKYNRHRFPIPGPESVQSFDPNDIVIPVGNGALNWVQAKPLPYKVEFENLADSATAPARFVRTRYRLDPSLEPGSLSLGAFGFRNMQFTIPAGRSQHQTRIDLRDSLGMYVDVAAVLNGDSLIWTFETIDPQTGWPVTDLMGGFLPINDSTGKGTGYVTFTVSPKPQAATGTRINAQALIVFDSNTPIVTATKFNTLDRAAPVSRVGTLDDSSATGFDVRWSGSDDAGIVSYSVYVTNNGINFQPWVSGVADTVGTFSGTLGSSYGFYSVAVDTAGNVERSKLYPEASTRVVTGIKVSGELPLTYNLYQNYPNPFNPSSTIRIALPEVSNVTLIIYNILGQRVRTLVDERLNAGYHNIRFDATGLASGIYFCRVRAGSYVATRKMLLLR